MRHVVVCAVLTGIAVPAIAQDRPFLFSVTTAEESKPALRFDYDVGVGERAFQSDATNQPEQRIGVQASQGRFTFLARFGIAEVESAYQSSQSGEALYSILDPQRTTSLAAGGGLLHEADGVNVLLSLTGRRWQMTATGGPVFHHRTAAPAAARSAIFRRLRPAPATRSKRLSRSRSSPGNN